MHKTYEAFPATPAPADAASLRRAIPVWILVLVAFALYWGQLLQSHQDQLNQTEQQTKLRAAQMASALSLQIGSLFNGVDYVSRTLAASYHPDKQTEFLQAVETAKQAFVTQQLQGTQGPVIASTDYMKAYAEQIRPFIPKGRSYKVLGTDGFGRSDFRSKLREHFEINRHYIVVAALKALADDGKLPLAKVAEAIQKYGIKADKVNPLYA